MDATGEQEYLPTNAMLQRVADGIGVSSNRHSVLIEYSSPEEIHSMLSLSTSPFVAGDTPEESLKTFRDWVKSVFEQVVPNCHVPVYQNEEGFENLVYDGFQTLPYSEFLACRTRLNTNSGWIHDCEQQGLIAGRFFEVKQKKHGNGGVYLTLTYQAPFKHMD